MLRTTLFCSTLLTLLLLSQQGQAGRGHDISAGDFIADSFTAPPPPQLLWLTPDLKPAIRDILGHDLNRLRIRYWLQGTRSAWILDEVGKERPITFGVVIDDGRIERLQVLAFRESRGWEIRYPFFTDQFNGARLGDGRQLDRHVDSISGATLSVRAATRSARLALFLHRQVIKKTP